jgi:hypothetical protein
VLAVLHRELQIVLQRVLVLVEPVRHLVLHLRCTLSTPLHSTPLHRNQN